MARTDAHTPYYAKALHAKDGIEVHRGCPSDPSGWGRIVQVLAECPNPDCSLAPIICRHQIVREVVECDLHNPTSFRSCHYDSDQAWIEHFGYRHRCHWPEGMKRAGWYGPERAQGRDYGQLAAREYNTFGEVLTDDPATRNSPSGLWGGGWID